MEGFVGFGEATDFEEGLRLGEQAGTELHFLITLRSADLDAMLDDDPDHGATIVGTVTCRSLSAQPLTITNGTFTWFGRNQLDPASKADKEMRYAMTLHSEEGKTFRLEGLKVIHDDPGFDLWSDTTRLFVTVKDGESADSPVLGKGILHMTPDSLVRSLTTFRVSGPHGPTARLAALSRFGWFFSGNLFTLFGGLAKKDEPSGDLSGGEVRIRRSLRAPIPSVHTVTTKDQVALRLTRYRGGTKGPVIVAHGFGMSSRMFSVDTIETNLVEHLIGNGYDTWLFDWRASIDLPASRTRFDGDRVALADWPAAIRTLRELTGAQDVQAVVHCVGSITFFMSMLAGLEGVRSVVSSQLATHMDLPPQSRLKGRLHLASALSALGVDSLDAFVDEHPDWTDRLWNQVVALQPIEEEERCDSAVCHRLTFMYGLLYEHDRLSSLTHATLSEQVGLANMELFEHLTRIGRLGHVVMADGTDTYLAHLDRLAVPTLFLHGAESRVFEPSSTERTHRMLAEANGPDLYRRVVLGGYGHLDTWMGKDAAKDVYPLVVEHLDRTNS
jgi:cholesterol oxidase